MEIRFRSDTEALLSHKLRCKHALRARGRPGPLSRRASENSFAVASGGAVWASNHTPHKCQSTQMEKEEEKITQNINIELIDKVISLNIHTSWKSHCCLIEGSLLVSFCGDRQKLQHMESVRLQYTHSTTDIETLFTDNHHNYVPLSWKDLREGKQFRLMCTVFHASDNRKINYHEKLFRLSLSSETPQKEQ